MYKESFKNDKMADKSSEEDIANIIRTNSDVFKTLV